jgi:hypothetical protein
MTNTEGFDLDHGQEPAVQATAPNARSGTRKTRTATREPPREPMRGETVYRGRNGEVLTRSAVINSGDPLYFDPSIIPEGWEYQWNTTDVYGSKDVARQQSNIMYRQGWRPVPAERHPGVFMPHDYKGPVMVTGAILEERPKGMCDEAREQQVVEARQQMRTQSESVMGKMSKALPDGYASPNATQRRSFKTGGDNLRMSIDKALDAPTPSYQPADDSIP